MMIDKLLDRPIAYHRALVDLTGSVLSALMLSQALYWHNRTSDPDGWFWKTQEEWTDETGMSRYEQETARKRLRQTSFWHEERRGIPARLFFRVDVESLHTSMLESHILDSGNPTNRNGGLQHTGMVESHNLYTETTSESTSETTHNNDDDEDYGLVFRRLRECGHLIESDVASGMWSDFIAEYGVDDVMDAIKVAAGEGEYGGMEKMTVRSEQVIKYCRSVILNKRSGNNGSNVHRYKSPWGVAIFKIDGDVAHASYWNGNENTITNPKHVERIRNDDLTDNMVGIWSGR